MYIRSSYASWCVVIQAGTICHHSKKHPQACRWTGLWDQKYSTGQALPCYAINLLALTHGLPRKWRKTNVFAKTTIILSYPFVYCFKPICYGMIVAILNYHSSIITIMAKDDNMLCINYTIKTGTVREQMRNLLKRLLFSSRQAFLLSKTACKAAWDPGAGEVQTRVCAKPFRECREVYPLYQGHFYAQFLHLIQRKEAFLWQKRPRFVNGYSAYVNINSALSSI